MYAITTTRQPPTADHKSSSTTEAAPLHHPTNSSSSAKPSDQLLPLLSNQFGTASVNYTPRTPTTAALLALSSQPTRSQDTNRSSSTMDVENSITPSDSEARIISASAMEMDNNEEESNPGPTKQQKLIKLGLLAALVAIVIYVIIDYTVPGLGFVADALKSFLEWVEDNPAEGAVAFAAVYIFTTVCFIPGSLLTLGAGLVFGRALGTGWGVLVGSVAVLVGATIGAVLAFLLGRFVLREQAQGLFNKFKILKAVDRAIESQGLKLVVLLRLSPVVPFSAFNYVMGVTAVHFRDYVLGCFGFIPGTVAYVFIGTTASSLLGDDDDAEEDDDGSSAQVQLIVIIVGAVATIIAVVLISIYAKRALNKVLEEGEEEDRRRATGGETAIEDAQDAAGVITSMDDVEVQGTGRPKEMAYPLREH